MKNLRMFLFGVAISLLDGSNVGPTYVKPTVSGPPIDSYKELDGWKTAQPSDQQLRGKWWEIFEDPQLTALEEQVDVSNQNLKIPEARFREARAIVGYNRASEFPKLSIATQIYAVRFAEPALFPRQHLQHRE